jgi:hypothetical protein
MEWDCRESAKSYANIASVLAGFAFAAVILVVQTPLDKNTNPLLSLLLDWTSIAFLISVFGCIVSSFVFSLISGEDRVSPRALTLMLLGGSGFSISGAYIFWGLSTITTLFLSENVSHISRLIFISTSLLVPVYLISIVVDIFANLNKKISRKDLAMLASCSYVLIFAALSLKAIFPGAIENISGTYFNLTALGSLVLINCSGIITAIASYSSRDFRLSINQSGYWITIHTLVYSSLLVLLP